VQNILQIFWLYLL